MLRAQYRCHTRAVCSLTTSTHCANVFWTASDDGTVRQFDQRVPHVCLSDSECRNVSFINSFPFSVNYHQCILSAHIGSIPREVEEVKWCLPDNYSLAFNVRHLQRLEMATMARMNIIDSRTQFTRNKVSG